MATIGHEQINNYSFARWQNLFAFFTSSVNVFEHVDSTTKQYSLPIVPYVTLFCIFGDHSCQDLFAVNANIPAALMKIHDKK